MKHKIQSSIFLQPIDQHFYANKNQSFPKDNSADDYFKDNNQNSNLNLDCFDNSTESDSGESKNEDEFSSESFKSNLRKLSLIAEKSVQQKFCQSIEAEKNKFSANENSNSAYSRKSFNMFSLEKLLYSEKNFHVPNFLLLDSEDDQSIGEKSYSSSFCLGSESFRSAKRSFPVFNMKDKINFEMNNNNFLNLNICDGIVINNHNKVINIKNKTFFGKLENLEIEKNGKTRISDFLHYEWKSKLNGQRFLNFNAFRKKVFESLSNKSQSQKKNYKNNANKNNYLKKNNKSNNNSNNINTYFSNTRNNLNYDNQSELTIHNNFSCDGKLNNINNSNQRKNYKNLNLNINQQIFTYQNQFPEQQQHQMENPNNIITCNNETISRYDVMMPRDPINYNFLSNNNTNNIYNIRNNNSAQNFRRTPIANLPLKNNQYHCEVNRSSINVFPKDYLSNSDCFQMNFPHFINNINNDICNFPNTNMNVNYSNNFINKNNQYIN